VERSLRRRRVGLALALTLWGWLAGGAAWAVGGSPFPHLDVLGWTPAGDLVSFEMQELGRGVLLIHSRPPREIPVKSGGLCGAQPRWACRLKLDPAQPHRAASAWLERVQRELELRPAVRIARRDAALPPSYPLPERGWELQVRREGPDALPTVELVLADPGSPQRFLVWQAILGLDAADPLAVYWDAPRHHGAVVARSAANPHPRTLLVAEPVLGDPCSLEADALARLGNDLRDRQATAVRLGPAVETLRVRSQRRRELGAILLDALPEPCPEETQPMVLDAESFDWSDTTRGGLLSYGCARAQAAPSVGHALFLRRRGRWEAVRTYPGRDGGVQRLLRADLAQAGHEQLIVLHEQAEVGKIEVLGWRGQAVDAIFELDYRAGCRALTPPLWARQDVRLGDPDGKGRAALVVDRFYFHGEKACAAGSSAGAVQEEAAVWRHNRRLDRFYRRDSVLRPAGAASLGPVDDPRPAATAAAPEPDEPSASPGSGPADAAAPAPDADFD